jgi:hypothetical protein
MISFRSFILHDNDECCSAPGFKDKERPKVQVSESHKMRLTQIPRPPIPSKSPKIQNILYYLMDNSHFALSTLHPLSQNDKDIVDFTVSLFICSWFNNLHLAVDEI